MNWTRVIAGGVVGGIVTSVADFVQHGILLGETYKKHAVFSQTQASPLKFVAVSVVIYLCVAILFARTRASWGAGWKGGLGFGFFFGLAIFFMGFYNPMVLAGFPYHLSWCWGGIGVIDGVIGGAVLGSIVRK